MGGGREPGTLATDAARIPVDRSVAEQASGERVGEHTLADPPRPEEEDSAGHPACLGGPAESADRTMVAEDVGEPHAAPPIRRSVSAITRARACSRGAAASR